MNAGTFAQAQIAIARPPSPMMNDAVNPNEMRPVNPMPWRMPSTTMLTPVSTAKGNNPAEPADAGSAGYDGARTAHSPSS